MNLTRNERAEVVAKILELDREFKALSDFEDDVAQPSEPAAQTQISGLLASTKVMLPPSYLDLLRLHDGIESFYWVVESLLSCQEQIDDPNFAAHWERPHLRFFILGDDFEGVAFDVATRRADDGEMEVLEFANNVETVRWPSLDRFLAGYLERLQGWLADARADRAAMDDD